LTLTSRDAARIKEVKLAEFRDEYVERLAILVAGQIHCDFMSGEENGPEIT